MVLVDPVEHGVPQGVPVDILRGPMARRMEAVSQLDPFEERAPTKVNEGCLVLSLLFYIPSRTQHSTNPKARAAPQPATQPCRHGWTEAFSPLWQLGPVNKGWGGWGFTQLAATNLMPLPL